jgi:hypothetical protein
MSKFDEVISEFMGNSTAREEIGDIKNVQNLHFYNLTNFLM